MLYIAQGTLQSNPHKAALSASIQISFCTVQTEAFFFAST